VGQEARSKIVSHHKIASYKYEAHQFPSKMKLKITITGPKVHDVGYRPFLIALADESELDGIGVRNIEVEGKQAVRIKAEGEEEYIREFEETVKTRRPEGAIVSDVRSEPFDRRVPSIERTAITNMNAQLAKGIKRLDELPLIRANTEKILEEVKGLRDEIQPGLGEQLRQMQADIRALKDRAGML
jgi:acylphosphatase